MSSAFNVTYKPCPATLKITKSQQPFYKFCTQHLALVNQFASLQSGAEVKSTIS